MAAFLDCEWRPNLKRTRFRCGKRCKPSWVTMVCPIRTNGCARECALSNVSMLIQGHDVQTCAARSCCSRPLATMQSNTFPLGEHMSVRTNPATSTVPHAKNKERRRFANFVRLQRSLVDWISLTMIQSAEST